MRAVIFVNGLVADYDELAGWLRFDDHIICADGGTRHCLALGLTPAAVVGDLDSVDPAILADLQAQGVEVERHSPIKDQTDLELALERALRNDVDEVLLLGALGGRLDQTIANLLLLAQKRWPVPVRIAEGNQLAQVLSGGETLTMDLPTGLLVSTIPLDGDVIGITYTGLAYPLIGAKLHFGSTRGVSNTVVESPVTIHIEHGTLLVVAEQPIDIAPTEAA